MNGVQYAFMISHPVSRSKWKSIYAINSLYRNNIIITCTTRVEHINIVMENKHTISGEYLPHDPTRLLRFINAIVPSVAPKNSQIFGILYLSLKFSHMSALNPFPTATLTLCLPSNGF
jgi:hypothetical protein